MDYFPKVSIILPTYNRADKIKKAVESVIRQSYQPWELIIINDASTDNTALELEKLKQRDKRIICIKNDENFGISKTLNKGLAMAKGEYIARIDDDDIWIDVAKLQKQVYYLDCHPECVLLGTAFKIINERGENIRLFSPPLEDKDIREVILFNNQFGHSSVLFRKNIVINIGGYNENPGYTGYMEDYDLWLRLGQKGKLTNLRDVTVRYVEYSNREALGISFRKQILYKIMILKKYRKLYPKRLLVQGRLLVLLILSYLPVLHFLKKIKKFFLRNKLIIKLRIRSSTFGLFLIKVFRRKKCDNIKRKAEIIQDFQKRYNIDIFVETGTYLGETIREIKDYFKNIYSIELDQLLFENAKRQFASSSKIRIIQGDSAKVLPEILRLIQSQALFWLDAHTSGGITAQGDKVTPIMEELLVIKAHPIKNHIILIDDAELFVGINNYPTVNKLKSIMREINSEYKFEIKENIIRIFL